jgi:phage terminase small subunit
MPKSKGLTPKQKRFIEEYLVDLNATQAAVRAGFSEKWANKYGPALLGKTRFKRAIQEAMDARSVRTQTTADEVLRELRILAFSDVTHYRTGERGRVVLSRGAPFWAKRALSSVKYKTRATRRRGSDDLEDVETDVEIKLWSKPEALKMLAQHLGIVKPTDLPPLEVVLGLLPAALAQQLRPILARALPDAPGAGGGPAREPVPGDPGPVP